VGELIVTELISINFKKATIDIDTTELEKLIDEKVKKYSGLIVTEDDISLAEDDRASLRKMGKAIRDTRIQYDKIIDEPKLEMDRILKELENRLLAPADEIDTQLKQFEQKRKDDLYDYYTSLPEWEDYMIFPDHWFNKTTKKIVVINDMKNQRSEHDRNVKLIEMLCGDLPKDNYIKLLNEKCDITDIIQRINEDKELLSKSIAKQENVVKNDLPTFNGKITIDYTITCEEHTHELIKEFLKEMNAEWKN